MSLQTVQAAALHAYSYLLGAVDNVYGLYCSRMTASSRRFFTKGFGQVKTYKPLEKKLETLGVAGFPDIQVEFTSENDCGTWLEQEGSFRSPLADVLPDESKIAYFKMITPKANPVKRAVVHLSSTGDTDFNFRSKFVAEPLVKHGVASIMLLIPFYGKRKPAEQTAHYISTVSDILVQSIGCCVESNKLLEFARKAFPEANVGLTGISYGGAMAGLAAIFSQGDVALSSCVGCASPRCIVNGVIHGQVSWKHLLAEDTDAQKTLRDVLESVNLTDTIHRLHDDKRQVRSGRLSFACVDGQHDKFVIASDGDELYSCMLSLTTADMVSRCIVPGGHASTILRAATNYVPQIIKSFELLEAKQAQSSA